MDFFGRLHAINHTPDRIQARQQNRAARRAQVFARIGEAIGETHVAQLSFALESQDPNQARGIPVGRGHPGQAAVLAVRNALSEYDLPTDLRVRCTGMQRYSGQGAYQMEAGIVNVEVGMRSLSGIDRTIDIPVMVRDGHILEPVCFFHQGEQHVIAQNALDNLIDRVTFSTTPPDRRNMYSPPPEDRHPMKKVPLIRPGLFGIGPTNRSLTAAYIQSAMRGSYVAPLPAYRAVRELEQCDEAPPPKIAAGDSVTLKRGIDIVGRGGVRLHLGKGTRGDVKHDVAGDGCEYFVYFDDLGGCIRVRGDDLSG